MDAILLVAIIGIISVLAFLGVKKDRFLTYFDLFVLCKMHHFFQFLYLFYATCAAECWLPPVLVTGNNYIFTVQFLQMFSNAQDSKIVLIYMVFKVWLDCIDPHHPITPSHSIHECAIQFWPKSWNCELLVLEPTSGFWWHQFLFLYRIITRIQELLMVQLRRIWIMFENFIWKRMVKWLTIYYILYDKLTHFLNMKRPVNVSFKCTSANLSHFYKSRLK